MFLRLHTDIIDAILTVIPDIVTLLSLISVAKGVYVVFETRRRSILNAVVHNQLGPVLPQALRLVRSAGDLPEESEVMMDPIILQEAVALAQNAKVATALEALYSFRNKDIRSETSQLTPAESLRFQRALYRYWLHCQLFSRRRDGGGDQVQNQGGDDDREQARVDFFDSLPTAELMEFMQFSVFMHDTTKWILVAVDGCYKLPDQQLIISYGPAVVLECYETCTIPRNNATAVQYGSLPYLCLMHAFRKREPVDLSAIEVRSTIILNDVIAQSERCSECGGPGGTMLWCSSNWHSLKGHIYRAHVLDSLPGQLSRNSVEAPTLSTRLRHHDHDGVTSTWDTIRDCIQSDTDDWSDGRALCYLCVLKLLGRRLLQWLVRQKASSKNPPQVDCLYGYDCETQVHDREHAAKLNHLCEPFVATGSNPS